jgi:hypothetical protein
MRQEEFLKESKDSEILRKGLETYENWRTRWDGVRQRASMATVKFRNARDQARLDLAELKPKVEVIEVSYQGTSSVRLASVLEHSCTQRWQRFPSRCE